MLSSIGDGLMLWGASVVCPSTKLAAARQRIEIILFIASPSRNKRSGRRSQCHRPLRLLLDRADPARLSGASFLSRPDVRAVSPAVGRQHIGEGVVKAF